MGRYTRTTAVLLLVVALAALIGLLLGSRWLTAAGFFGFVGVTLWAAFQARRHFRRRDKSAGT